MVVAGLGCLGYFGWIYFQQSDAASWPTVSAKVVTSHIEQEASVSARRGAQTNYLARIEFQYTVDDTVFTSTDLWFDSEPVSTNRLDMVKLTDEYPVGKTISVYYNPAKPQRAVKIPDKNATLVKWAMGGGALSLIIGALLAWSGTRSPTTKESSLAASVRPLRPMPGLH